MSDQTFRFKQFSVIHESSAMKIGTDSVLLGAWVNANNCTKILDVGAGTGILSLMLAQRTPASIDAVELDEEACTEAAENFRNSPWGHRLHPFNQRIQDYSLERIAPYDLIISNPPYFQNGPIPVDERRAIARQTSALTLEELFIAADVLLSKHGIFSVILPYELRLVFIANAIRHKLWVQRQLIVRNSEAEPPVRVLFELARIKPEHIGFAELNVRKSLGGEYSEEFRCLTREFYLHF